MSKKTNIALLTLAAVVLVAAFSIAGHAKLPDPPPMADRPTPVSFALWCTSDDTSAFFCGYGPGVAAWTWSADSLGLLEGQILVIEYVSFGVNIDSLTASSSLAQIDIGDDLDAAFDSFWMAPGDPVRETDQIDARTVQANGHALRLYVDDDDSVRIYLELSENEPVSGWGSFSGYILEPGSTSLSP